MDVVMTSPAWLKVGVTFGAILAANVAGLPLGAAILVFSLVLALWSGLGVMGTAALFTSFSRPENYLLPPAVLLLLFFTESLGRTGRIEATMETLGAYLRDRRLLLAGLPALVGLLPMPGGALFSAPLVAAADGRNDLDGATKGAVNYWFRHLWEYWWPLYPGVILAVRYSGLPLWLYMAAMIPFTLVAFAGGYLFILRPIGHQEKEGRKGERRPPLRLPALGPIMILVTLSLAGSLVLPLLGWRGTAASLLAMIAGLAVALPIVFRGAETALTPSLAVLRKGATWNMILLVAAIQVFSFCLTAPLPGGGTLVAVMRDEFVAAGVPLVALMMVIPFISGLVTGVAFGFVGASFPIIFALLGADPPAATAVAATVLSYSFGYIGMMLSPLHVCYVVTCEYFGTSLFAVYPRLIGPAATVLAAGTSLAAAVYLSF